MKLTRQEELIILVASEIAAKQGARVSLAEISSVHGISNPYLKKITRMLKIAGIVSSKEGSGGGYVLTKPAESITVLDLLKSAGMTHDGPDLELAGKRVCPLQPDCLPQRIRQRIETTFLTYCGNITLDQLIKKGNT